MEDIRAELAGRLKVAQSAIAKACQVSGRSTAEVQLLAVSKFQSIFKIQVLNDLGLTHFGESYLQEVQEKQKALQKREISWHYIGKLQSKKLNKLVGSFSLIESVESWENLLQIQDKAQRKSLIQPVLLQVNVGDESSKAGFSLDELLATKNQLSHLSHAKLCGLMCLPPLAADEDQKRSYFKQMKSLLGEIRAELSETQAQSFKELSMGTSHDFPLAVEEGATIVRIGTSLFGDRSEQAEISDSSG